MIIVGYKHYDKNFGGYFHEYFILILLLSMRFFKIKTPIKIFLEKDFVLFYQKLIKDYNLTGINYQLIPYKFKSENFNIRYELIYQAFELFKIKKTPILYLDIDTIFINNIDLKFKEILNDKCFYAEIMPKKFWKKELQYGVEMFRVSTFFLPFFFIINNYTFSLFYDFFKNINFSDKKNQKPKELDLCFSSFIEKNNIKYKIQNFALYNPIHIFKNIKYPFLHHYDNLEEDGSLYLLKEHKTTKKLYKYIYKKISILPGYEGIKNDPKYFNKFK